MSIVVFIAYLSYGIYDIRRLKKSGSIHEIWVYGLMLSISVVFSGLLILNFHIQDIAKPIEDILKAIKGFVGGSI